MWNDILHRQWVVMKQCTCFVVDVLTYNSMIHNAEAFNVQTHYAKAPNLYNVQEYT